jgi:hypothetical protein
VKPRLLILAVNMALLAAWLGRYGLDGWPEGN